MRYLMIVLALAMASCASEKITMATGRTVVVRAGFPDMGVEKALALADSECAKRDLSARVQQLTSPNTDKYIFECVRVQ